MVTRLSLHTRSLPSGWLHLLHVGCCTLTLQLLYMATHAFTAGSISTISPPWRDLKACHLLAHEGSLLPPEEIKSWPKREPCEQNLGYDF